MRHVFFCIVDRHRDLGTHIKEMRRADDIIRTVSTARIIHIVKLNAAEDLYFVAVDVCQPADLIKVRLNVHVDVRIHVAGKAQLGKAQRYGLLHHLFRSVLTVAECGVRVEIGK